MTIPLGKRASIIRPRSRTTSLILLVFFSTLFLLFSGPAPQLRIIPQAHDTFTGNGGDNNVQYPAGDSNVGGPVTGDENATDAVWNISIDDLRHWKDPDDQEDPNDVLPGDELDGASRTPADVARLQHEKDQRKLWRHAYKSTAGLQTSDLIYGNTLQSLDFKETQSGMHSEKLGTEAKAPMSFATERPFSYNPYPRYNGVEWVRNGHGRYVPCPGPTGDFVEDLLVFKGRPTKWPSPKFGSYDLLGMDPNICWERETRLGPYKKPRWSGLTNSLKWGALQRQCLMLNSQRFDLTKLHRNERPTTYSEAANLAGKPPQPKDKDEERVAKKTKTDGDAAGAPTWSKSPLDIKSRNSTTEKQTAILLRSYTGMQYTENDRRVIRALVSELSLRTGGEYMVFLLIHSKDKSLRISDDSKLYQKVLRDNVPAEFRDMAILWSDEEISRLYPELKDEDAKSVHYGQWLCVQKFSNDHPQFDFIWNWEMDFRFTGHHYDLLSNLDAFARKQPRKYLWERNERWYIPSYHGDYDTAFRTEVARTHGNDTVWGPPKLPFISPVGPQPPVESPSEDDYIWGIGEDADLITVGPIFDPKNSQWIMSNDIWGYEDKSTNHASSDLPRRATIITHSRLSKRLLDVMHLENLRGNQVASEMTPQTVSLLHGLKAVYAPHPVYMDRNWTGEVLNKWFNPGPKGECGGRGSPMGWGRERRYQGTTWYYRAEPPNRLYNNWMGWTDTGIGGAAWERKHGRPCLPSVMLHEVKNTRPTKLGHQTGFNLGFG